MTTAVAGGELVSKLPFQVRPKPGEGGRSFIRRLAQANHLPPAYLRKYLTAPPHHRGSPSWDRLAAVTGRDPVQLRQILETIECAECGTKIPPLSSFGVKPRTCSRACRQKKHRRNVIMRPCGICGKPMRIQLGQRRFLCSSPCRRTAYLRRQNPSTADSESESESGAGSEPPDCDICGRLLPYQAGPKRRYCSAACRASASRWGKQLLEPHRPDACVQCGAAFQTSQPNRRWCSRACRERAVRQKRVSQDPAAAVERTGTCDLCGTAFQTKKASRRWCSHACRQKAVVARRPPTPPKPKTSPITITTCLRCETTFPSRRRSPCPWCSAQCWEQELTDRRHRDVCGICTTPLTNSPLEATRRWCCRNCRVTAGLWRAELRERQAS